MSAADSETRSTIEDMSRDELNILAKKLRIPKFRSMNMRDLQQRCLETEPSKLAKHLNITWWNRYHKHVYGIGSIVLAVIGIVLAIVLYIDPFGGSPQQTPVPMNIPSHVDNRNDSGANENTGNVQDVISLMVGQSNLHTFDGDVYRIAIADPEIADVVPHSLREVELIAKSVGETNLTVWTGGRDTPFRYDVNVTESKR